MKKPSSNITGWILRALTHNMVHIMEKREKINSYTSYLLLCNKNLPKCHGLKQHTFSVDQDSRCVSGSRSPMWLQWGYQPGLRSCKVRLGPDVHFWTPACDYWQASVFPPESLHSCGLFSLHGSQGSWWQSIREQPTVFLDLVSEVVFHCFYSILIIRSR
jgi:hypothetical protein